MEQDLWNIVQPEYNSNENSKYETIFTLANGYRGLRGSIEFSKIGCRGNFIAGIFDKSDTQVTEIVNCQDPLPLNLYIEDEPLDFEKCSIYDFNRTLNMEEGVLYLKARLETPKGKMIGLTSERYVSKNDVHRWGIKYTIIPLNFSGKLFIENIIDGTITNSAWDPSNIAKHFSVMQAYDFAPGIALKTSTLEKHIEVMESSVLIGKSEKGDCLKSRKYNVFGEKVREFYEVFVNANTKYTLYKLGCTYSSRDTEDIECSCRQNMLSFIKDGFEAEKSFHIEAMKKIWNTIDIRIEGDSLAQIGIRFNLFQLSSSAYRGDERVSIAAKALHGEGYKGHVFWDTEVFMLPFFIYTMPDVAKSLLLYRYNTLKGARKNARLNGYKGAQFPWESADEGLEVTPKWGFDYDGNPIRIWTGDEEYHINSDITFGIYEYYRATLDKEFMLNFGLEIFFDTATFWKSRVEYNEPEDRYEVNKVIGPDEFHEHVNNNVYTNYLAKWSLKKALQFAMWAKKESSVTFDRLCTKLGLDDSDFKQWDTIQQKIYIPTGKDGKLIEEFEGYFKLPDVTISQHDENGMPLWPELNGVRYNDTQLIKQPDVVMLMIMLGEEFDKDTKLENYKYYEARTMHKSSLSPSMYSILGLAVGDTRNSYRYFIKTIMTDLEDNQGNTALGFHAASAGGSWQSAIFGFGGLNIDKGMILNLNPWIPDGWKSMSFTINWQNSEIHVKITRDALAVTSSNDIKIKVYGKDYFLSGGKNYSINGNTNQPDE